MFEQVKQEIDNKIKTNGNNEITANRLNGVLQDMMDASAEVIEEVQQSIGDHVEANPTGEATEMLGKLKIGETIYKTGNPFAGEVDATDEERLKALANVSNQTANSTTGKMGYKVLDPTKTFASQVTAENTIYEIRDVFDLGGTQETPVSVTLPAGSTLKVNGGIIKNCTLQGNNNTINADYHKIFDNVQFTGTWNCRFISDWFLSVGLADYTTELTYMFNCGIPNIYFTYNHTYNVTDTIIINDDIVIGSLSESKTPRDTKTIINCNSYKTVIHYKHRGNYTIPINIGGIFVRSGDGSTASTTEPDYTTSIVKVELMSGSSIWGGAKIYFDISCNNTYQYIDGVQYNRLTMIGLDIISTGGTGSFIEINGRISSFVGIKIEKTVEAAWITDTHVNCITECCFGGIFDIGAPIFIGGSHQSVNLPNDLNTFDCYFIGNIVQCDSIVWDLNSIKSDNIRSVKYAFNNPATTRQESKYTDIVPNIGTHKQNYLLNDSRSYALKDLSSFTNFDISVFQDDTQINITKDDVILLNNIVTFKLSYSGSKIEKGGYNYYPYISNEKTLLLDQTKPITVVYSIEYRENLNNSIFKMVGIIALSNISFEFYGKNNNNDNYTLIRTFISNLQQNTNNNRFIYTPILYANYKYLKLIVKYNIPNSGYSFKDGNKIFYLYPFNFIIGDSDTKPALDVSSLKIDRLITQGLFNTSDNYYHIYERSLTKGFGFDCNADSSLIIWGYTFDDRYARIKNNYTVYIKSNGDVFVENLNSAFKVYKETSSATGLTHFEVNIDATLVNITKICARGFIIESLKPYNSSIVNSMTRLTNVAQKRTYGTTSQRPSNLDTYSVGEPYFDTTIKREGYWSGTKFVDEKGYTLALSHGSTTSRPTNLGADDSGFQYFDETLGKFICWIYDTGTSTGDWYNLDGTALS